MGSLAETEEEEYGSKESTTREQITAASALAKWQLLRLASFYTTDFFSHQCQGKLSYLDPTVSPPIFWIAIALQGMHCHAQYIVLSLIFIIHIFFFSKASFYIHCTFS